MAKFSQEALLTYAQNRDRPNALLTLAASVSPAEAKAAPKKITVGSLPSKPKKKGKGSPGQIKELFYDPINAAYKNGQALGSNIGGHSDHVHVAADRNRVEYLGRVAQKMGLRVSEQDKFGGRPSGGHAPNSWHYSGQAIDVSGDSKRMAAFARLVRRQYRLK